MHYNTITKVHLEMLSLKKHVRVKHQKEYGEVCRAGYVIQGMIGAQSQQSMELRKYHLIPV